MCRLRFNCICWSPYSVWWNVSDIANKLMDLVRAHQHLCLHGSENEGFPKWSSSQFFCYHFSPCDIKSVSLSLSLSHSLFLTFLLPMFVLIKLCIISYSTYMILKMTANTSIPVEISFMLPKMGVHECFLWSQSLHYTDHIKGYTAHTEVEPCICYV